MPPGTGRMIPSAIQLLLLSHLQWVLSMSHDISLAPNIKPQQRFIPWVSPHSAWMEHPCPQPGLLSHQLTHPRGVSQRNFCSSFNSEGRSGGLVVQEDVVASVSADTRKPMWPPRESEELSPFCCPRGDFTGMQPGPVPCELQTHVTCAFFAQHPQQPPVLCTDMLLMQACLPCD